MLTKSNSQDGKGGQTGIQLKINIPKKKNTDKHLSFSPVLLVRHPSAKNLNALSQENSNSKDPPDSPCSIGFSNNNPNDKAEPENNKLNNNEENILLKSPNKTNIKIDIDSVEHKIFTNNDNFYTKNENPIETHNKESIITPSKKSNFYDFDNNQKILDELITKNIQNGKSFNEIEKDFFILQEEKNEKQKGFSKVNKGKDSIVDEKNVNFDVNKKEEN